MILMNVKSLTPCFKYYLLSFSILSSGEISNSFLVPFYSVPPGLCRLWRDVKYLFALGGLGILNPSLKFEVSSLFIVCVYTFSIPEFIPQISV